MSPPSARLASAVLSLSTAPTFFSTAAAAPRPDRPPVEAPRPVLLTLDDAAWAGPIIVMPAATPAVDPAKDAASRVDPQAAIERAFRMMEAGWGDDALADELAPYFDAATARGFAAVARSFDRSPETFRPVGLTPLRVTRLGGAAVRYDYLQTFPRAVLLWSFTFSRHDGRWLFRNITWNRHLGTRPDLFDAAAAERSERDPGGPDLAEPDAAVGRFAETLGADAEAALTTLMTPAATPDADLRPEDRSFVDLALRLRAKVGWKHRGVELVSVVPLTPAVVRYALVERSDDDTFVWQVYFYRAADGWAVIDAQFDSGVTGLSRLLPGLPPPERPAPAPTQTPDRPAGDDPLRLGNDPFRRN